MSTHTPAPWSVNYTTLSGAIIRWHIAGPKYGSAYPICEHVIEERPDGSEQVANALLMAASPDLLTALRAFIAAEDSFRANTGMPYPSGEGDDMSEAYTLAKAAIAKAEGSK